MTNGLDVGLADHPFAMAVMDRNGWCFAGHGLQDQRNTFADLYEQVTSGYDALAERYGDPSRAIAVIDSAPRRWHAIEAERLAPHITAPMYREVADELFDLGFDTADTADIVGAHVPEFYERLLPGCWRSYGTNIAVIDAAAAQGVKASPLGKRVGVSRQTIGVIVSALGYHLRPPAEVYDWAFEHHARHGKVPALLRATKARWSRKASYVTYDGLRTALYVRRMAVAA